LGLPLGLGIHFVIDGTPYVVPMAIEEPSVVAAVSSAAKTISLHGGGIVTEGYERSIVEGTIRFADLSDEDYAEKVLLAEKSQWIRKANEFCPSMVKRGGGVLDMIVRRFQGRSGKRYFVVHLVVDVGQSMGSNKVNSVTEELAPLLQKAIGGGQIHMAIVSNLSSHHVVKAKFQIPLSKLEYKGMHSEALAKKIVDANEWADDDLFRAVTHNKGIMNGIDAVALATGQDWRAIEAAIHVHQISTKGYYGSLTTYTINRQNALEGVIELPIITGTQGGVLSSNTCYTYSLRLLGYPSSSQLAKARDFRCYTV
jgi:degradative hydroxymethylglutaryl-CoA reductase